MKTLVAAMLGVSVMLAGNVTEASGCPGHPETAEKPKACGYNSAKAKGCNGCAAMHMGNRQLRVAGADVEVVRTKNGYIVIATTDKEAKVQAVREANAARLKALVEFGATSGSKDCDNCEKFAKAVKSGQITCEEVRIEKGVMTVYTATTEQALATLHKSCAVLKGIKA